MTWRTFFYCLLCFVAALVVASATGPGFVHDAQSTASGVVAMQNMPTPAVSDPTRLVALVFGLVAVMLTFQKAWTNFRRS